MSQDAAAPTPRTPPARKAPRPHGARGPTPLRAFGAFLKQNGPLALAIAFLLIHLAGGYATSRPHWAPVTLGCLALWGVSFAAWRIHRLTRGVRVPLRTDVALGLTLVAVVYAAVQVTGDLSSPLYPLVLLLAALFAVSPLPRAAALGLVASVVLQNVLRHASLDALVSGWTTLVTQTGFTLVFALLYHLLLAVRVWSSQAAERDAVARRVREAEEEARALRLVVADRSHDRRTPGDDGKNDQRLLLGSLVEVERAVGSLVEGGRLALSCNVLALYWLAEDETTLSLLDGRCSAGSLSPGPLPAGDGILGAVLRRGQPFRAHGRVAGVTWYERGGRARAVLAVPVIERAVNGTGYVRGALVTDRPDPDPFTDREQLFLAELADQVARAVQAERLVGELHRAKSAQDRLRRAADELNRAASVDEVARSAAQLARELVPGLELAAVTRVDDYDDGRFHLVVAAEGPDAGTCAGVEFPDNDGVVSNVVRLGAPLPAKKPGVVERVRVFDEKQRSPGSLRVLPVGTGGTIHGALVVWAQARGVLDRSSLTALDGLASLASGAFGRARALEQLEALATTDALTGLANRRQVQHLGGRALKEARRYGRPFSVLITDVDRFKSVNDTHGHAVGDEVLRVVGALLAEEARATDIAGRWGGEEFVLVLPQTDSSGAMELAERIRARLAATRVPTAAGDLQVTLSLGVATLPQHGTTLDALVDAADAALYRAKEGGRNRVELAAA